MAEIFTVAMCALPICRETFLIDPKGTIVYHYNSVNPESHATQVLADVAKLAKK